MSHQCNWVWQCADSSGMTRLNLYRCADCRQTRWVAAAVKAELAKHSAGLAYGTKEER